LKGSFGQLINKLVRSDILEKKSDVLHFTPAFCRYVLQNQAKKRSNSLESWRELLESFAGGRLDITDEEVTNVMVYLDYYLAKYSSPGH
jgi:hypothetical protein